MNRLGKIQKILGSKDIKSITFYKLLEYLKFREILIGIYFLPLPFFTYSQFYTDPQIKKVAKLVESTRQIRKVSTQSYKMCYKAQKIELQIYEAFNDDIVKRFKNFKIQL